jgi:MFS family permease
VGVYTGNLPDIQKQTRGTSTLAAGYNASLQSVIPIILTPLTGAFFDRFGWRMPFVSWTGMLYVVVFALIGLTTVHPLGPILLSSFALSTNAVTFIASIPVIVGDDRLLGTAYGVWKAFVRDLVYHDRNTNVVEQRGIHRTRRGDRRYRTWSQCLAPDPC